MNSNFGEATLDSYTFFETLGRGQYGEVKKAKDNRTKEVVAIKKIIFEIENEGFPSTSIREISLLREIENKNVIELKDVFIDKKQLYLVFEYLDKDLKTYIESLPRDQDLEPIKVKKISVPDSGWHR